MQQKDEKNAGYTILTAADQKKVWRSKYNPLGSVSDLNEADQHPVILFSMLLPSTPPRMTPSYMTTTSFFDNKLLDICVCVMCLHVSGRAAGEPFNRAQCLFL